MTVAAMSCCRRRDAVDVGAGDDDRRVVVAERSAAGAARDGQLVFGGARPLAAREVHGRSGTREGRRGSSSPATRAAVDVRVAPAAVDDAETGGVRRRARRPAGRSPAASLSAGSGHAPETADGFLTCAFSHGLPTSAISLASSFLWSMFDCRAIMMRCACGEPAPCIDSVR